LSALVEVSGRAGVDDQDVSAGGGELIGVFDEVMDLLDAEGALVAGVSAQNDQDDGALVGEAGEGQGVAVGGGEGEAGGLLADVGGLGQCPAEERGEEERQGDLEAGGGSGHCEAPS
jgi:hypothetical protein